MKTTDTHTTHREVELLETLRGWGGSARTAALAEALGVSEETVRRTVKALAKGGRVHRVHGGVYLANSDAGAPVRSRLEKYAAEKTRIAAAAAGLIPNGACIFLDVGSTTAFVAEALRDHRDLTVVTNGLYAAQSLVRRNGNTVWLAGGELREAELGTFGTSAMAFVERFNIDMAVLSVDGIDPDSGFLIAGAAEAELARAVTKHARRNLVVVGQTKFGQTAPMVACAPTAIDLLVTDAPLQPVFEKRMLDWDIELVVARKGRT
ncbi:DeoR/GlpR family DNA-binding transcription regulator [Roseovarius sp. E0-M6]|uniref:DeoR/GlpR family DNA-binding transcription regulator n=1 Tax=Roseovarius sp. E0-M6 TaxID=3127118 RepID=UPI00300FD383